LHTFCLAYGGLEQALLDRIERLSFLDEIAFLEQDLLKISRDPGPDFHPMNGFDATDKVQRSRHRLPLRRDDLDRNRRRLLRRLRESESRKSDQQHQRAGGFAHSSFPFRPICVGTRPASGIPVRGLLIHINAYWDYSAMSRWVVRAGPIPRNLSTRRSGERLSQ
jgi:hypothetical protein